MPNPALKDHLLELRSAANDVYGATDEVDSLEEEVNRYLPHVPDEDDDDERSFRVGVQERKDRAATVLAGLLVVINVGCCAGAMWTSSLSILELLFMISIFQGPFLIYQNMQLSVYSSKREWIGKLWYNAKELRKDSNYIRLQMIILTDKVKRLVDGQAKYAEYTKGYNVTQIRKIYRENERVNAEKKRLAEAIGLQNLTTDILRSDTDRDHQVGENELALLATRLESRGGIPFTGDDLIEAFAGREDRSLRDLAGVVQELYVERRRHQVRTKEVLYMDGSPRNLGTSILLGDRGTTSRVL